MQKQQEKKAGKLKLQQRTDLDELHENNKFVYFNDLSRLSYFPVIEFVMCQQCFVGIIILV